MSKRPPEVLSDAPGGKVARLDALPGVVKKTGARLPVLLYREGETLDKLMEYLTSEDGNPQNVEIRIPGHYVSSSNRKVRSRQLWGSDIYTSDSDLVAVLMHCGFVHHTIPTPLRDVSEVRAVLKPRPKQDSYVSVPRNSIRSRAWNSPTEGCSYSVEKAWVVTRNGNSYDLTSISGHEGNLHAVIPTFTPSRHERMVTRSSLGPAGKQKQNQEAAVVFSLSNDPWMKYSVQSICDQGLKPHDRTSARLHSQVMFLETNKERYEISKTETKNGEEKYCFAKCRNILSSKEMRTIGIPLPENEKDMIEEKLLWEEIEWSVNAVAVRGKSYPIVRVHFMEIQASENDEAK